MSKRHNELHLLLGFLALNLRAYNSDLYDSHIAHRDEIQSTNEMDGEYYPALNIKGYPPHETGTY